MRTVLLMFLLLTLVSEVKADGVLLSEGFEPGFTPSGWIFTDHYGDGSWTIDNTTALSGYSSLKLTGMIGNIYLSYDLGMPMEDIVLECWFYDALESTKETFVSVSGSSDYLITTREHLKIGTSCHYDGGNYIAGGGGGLRFGANPQRWVAQGYYPKHLGS